MIKIKRILGLVLVICLACSIFTVIPIYAAQSGKCGENLTWTLDDNGTLTISGTGSIEKYQFASNSNFGESYLAVKSIIIKESVTGIGNHAFEYFKNLTHITIPDSITIIGSSVVYETAFYKDNRNWENGVLYINNHLIEVEDNNYDYIKIKDGIKTIAGSAFQGCNVASVIIPNSVTYIGDYAFTNCYGLASITIPSSVTKIGIDTFGGSRKLTSISVSNQNPNYSSDDGVLFNKNKTELIQYPIGKVGQYTIPDNVTSIGKWAFSGCSTLTEITIPDSVTSIGEWAFSSCFNLTDITIPNSVIWIGLGAFSDTAYYHDESNWENDVLYIGNHLIEVKADIYGNYSIKSGTKTIGAFTALNNHITSITIPNSVTSIGDEAFFWDTENPPSLQSISMPNSVTIIGDKAFEYCSNLTDVYYGGSESDWSKISIGYDNEPLFNAKIHYNDNGTYVAFAQADNSQITVTINNQEVQFDQPPIIIDGRTLIPLRAIFEGLGANVAWREDVKTVVATRGAKTISLRIGENVLYLNTRAVTLDVPPQIINDRTLVPVRAISEALNCKVDWDDKSKTVKIESDISRVIEIEEYDKTDNKKTKWAFSYDDTDYEMIGYLNGIKIFKCSYDKEGKLVYEENESGEKVSQSEFIIWGGKDIYEAYNNATVLGNGNRVFFKDKGDNDWEKCIFDENGRLISVETYNSDLKSKSINTVRYNKNDEIERVDEEICDETSTLKVGFRKYEYDENGNITSIEASSGNRVTITYEKCKRYPGVLYNQTFGLRMNSLSVGY